MMRARTVTALIAGMVAGALLLSGVQHGFEGTDSETKAQDEMTWQIAGPPEGFAIGDMNAGLGPERSLDEWVEQLPIECDIELLERGGGHVTVLYRCPLA